MTLREPSPRRSPIEWSIRCVLAAFVAVAGVYTIKSTLGTVLQANPHLAYALAPGDGRITARLSQQLLKPPMTGADRAEAERLARLALRQDATAVRAAATLGLSMQVRGDTVGARRVFAYAQALSRRDLQTQLWAIEDSVARDDIHGALRHYDIALRTSSNAPGLLFPVLASAISDPVISSALIQTFARGPNWQSNFIDYIAESGPDPRGTSRLFAGMRRAGVSQSETSESVLINRLVADGHYDDAWAYYALIRDGANRLVSRDPHFTADLTAPSPFDWNAINEGGVTTSVQRRSDGGVFDFAVPPSMGGLLLQQVQMLPAGRYRLEGHSVALEVPPSARPYWVLMCSQGQEVGRIDVPNSTQANGSFSGEFQVPAGCPVQTLALVARSSDAMGGVSGQIDGVRLSPLR